MWHPEPLCSTFGIYFQHLPANCQWPSQTHAKPVASAKVTAQMLAGKDHEIPSSVGPNSLAGYLVTIWLSHEVHLTADKLGQSWTYRILQVPNQSVKPAIRRTIILESSHIWKGGWTMRKPIKKWSIQREDVLIIKPFRTSFASKPWNPPLETQRILW